MAISTGSKAPEFSLKSKQGDKMVDVQLSDYAGTSNVVLLFFPFAFTSVCTAEMCDQSSGLGEYDALGAKVIGISVDSPFAQEAWGRLEHIGITLASDLNKETAFAYGTLLENIGGLGSASARAAFVIDKEGIVRYSEQTPTPKDLPDFKSIKIKLAELK
jgi:glutaredoxin-dependent peroxiredoxin